MLGNIDDTLGVLDWDVGWRNVHTKEPIHVSLTIPTVSTPFVVSYALTGDFIRFTCSLTLDARENASRSIKMHFLHENADQERFNEKETHR